ncbi:MAG: MoxR family ATPase [Spirochaetia bacterium]|jgi:MoxR-like ATPase|nr:MoxR family ATPase [Spirochaetia bacterium]
MELWKDHISLKKDMLEKCSYIISDVEAFTIFMALKLKKPLLIEGPPGSGKTEVAKVIAGIMDADLIRLQCYEGLDESKALYEWNYQKQIIDIQRAGDSNVFGQEYLLPRPLLQVVQARQTSVLLIDEIDKVDPEFEAFLMEILSDFQVSIPEFGTVKAETPPPVIITSNAVRDLGDALRRRCVYLYLDYPAINREASILMRKIVNMPPLLALQIARIMFLIRQELQLIKPPSISETLDIGNAALAMGFDELNADFLSRINSLYLKTKEDYDQYSNKGGGKWLFENI